MSKKDIAVKKNFLDRIKSSKTVNKKKSSVSTETLRRAAARPKAKGKLLFALDATASRARAWEISKKITHTLFDTIPGELEVSLSYHGGSRVKKFTPFTRSFQKFQDELAVMRCEGGMTQLIPILEKAVNIDGIGAISYIGDCFEESLQEGISVAQRLKIKGTKLFVFQDKSDGENLHATQAFTTLIDICGGALLDFNEQAATEAEELLSAVALYSAGGTKLLEEQKKLPGPAKLLKKMK